MTDTLTPDELDQATIDLIFALRDSLTRSRLVDPIRKGRI